MSISPARLRASDGFTIVEVMVAVFILLVGVLGTLALADQSNSATVLTAKREAATNLARQFVETTRKAPYTDLTTGATLDNDLKAQVGLADADTNTPGWQIVRRGLTFTAAVTACTVDDPDDGLATHTGSPYCSNATASSPADANPDDQRRVTVTLTPPSGSGLQTVTQTAVIAKRGTGGVGTGGGAGSTGAVTAGSLDFKQPLGSGAGKTCDVSCDTSSLGLGWVSVCYSALEPACSWSNPGTACPTAGCTTTVAFTVNTAGTPASVKWALDGVVKGSASGGPTTWSFTWNLGSSTYPQPTVDGAYELSAQAYDASGQPVGSPAKKTVRLNRFRPDAVYGPPTAGRNPLWGSVPEVEWYPTTASKRFDRDIIGVVLERDEGSGNKVTAYWICDTQAKTLACSYPYDGPGVGNEFTPVQGNWWRDTTTPAPASGTTPVKYDVNAQERTPNGEIANGLWTAGTMDVNLANTRPDPPTAPSVNSSGGATTLSWAVPTTNAGSGDPNNPTNSGVAGSDCVDFFRIYRASTGTASPAITDRYDRTANGVVSGQCGTVAQSSITDTDPCPSQCKYWLTSVDKKLAESTLVYMGQG